MQNQSKINTVLLVIVIILLAVGIWAILIQKKSTENIDNNFPTSTDINNVSTPNTPVQMESNIPTSSIADTIQSQTGPRVGNYSNSTNGFSFKYPSTWKAIDNAANKQVKVTTNDAPADGNGAPAFSITFTSTDQTFFNQRISTKYGEITYDQNRNRILIDGQCRAVESVQGSSLQGVKYGGSLMSDPAYGDSAIVTNNKNIIIVHTEMGTALSDATRAQIKSILDSFTLLNGNSIFIPVCN
jgi:hypothetical protein